MERLSNGIEKEKDCLQTFDGYFVTMNKGNGACYFCGMGVAVLSTGKMSLTDMINDNGFGIKKILEESYFDFTLKIEDLDHIEAKFNLSRFADEDSIPRIRKPLSMNMQYYNDLTLFNLAANLNDRYRLSFIEIIEIIKYVEDNFGSDIVGVKTV